MTVGQYLLQAAKLASPNPRPTYSHLSAVIQQACQQSMTLLIAPPGSLCLGGLAGILVNQFKHLFWLRLGLEDQDPATLLLSLIAAMQRLEPNAGAATLKKMRTNPGELAGWQPLFRCCGQELGQAIPDSTVLVIERAHYLNDPPLLSLLAQQALAGLSPGTPQIILSDNELPALGLSPSLIKYGPEKLKMDSEQAERFRATSLSHLRARIVHKLFRLVGDRSELACEIISLAQFYGEIHIEGLIDSARTVEQILLEIASIQRKLHGDQDGQTLALTYTLGYNRQEINQAVVGEPLIDEPWYLHLYDDWWLIRGEWNQSLRSAFRTNGGAPKCMLSAAATYLVQTGDFETATKLYFQAGDLWKAGQMLARIGEKLLDYGQWVTLRRWLLQLTPDVLNGIPLLLYLQGEIEAASSQTKAARHSFATAASAYSKQKNQSGLAKSLLAESALAFWESDREHAQLLALKARGLGSATDPEWFRYLTDWQLGCVNAGVDETVQALEYLGRAERAGNGFELKAEIACLTQLLKKKAELQQQLEMHSQALVSIEQTKQEVAAQISQLVHSQTPAAAPLLNSHGWSKVPLFIKLDPPKDVAEADIDQKRKQRWRVWWQGLFRRNRTGEKCIAEAVSAPACSFPLAETPPDIMLASPAFTAKGDNPPGILLTVQMLGAFQVTLGCQSVRLPNSRSLSLLKYLLFYHKRDLPREVLMDAFWPDSEPEAARNNLNVAMHNLRHTFHEVSDGSIIEFINGAYHLNLNYQIWIDVEEFEHHKQAGQRYESQGNLPAAINEFEYAVHLYQGDFLEDDLYEDWPISIRERIRTNYLDLLDRLARIHFSRGEYPVCITLLQTILEYDNCREDIHCLLMRCYYHQKQPSLALRQYQQCVEILQSELGIEPEPGLQLLATQIRSGASIS